MAITSMAQLNAAILPKVYYYKLGTANEAAGIPMTPLYVSGKPTSAALPATGINGAALTFYTGQIDVPAPVAGKAIYLAGMEYTHQQQVYSFTLNDRLWHNSGIATTTLTAQAITFPTLPARDNLGGTTGNGLMAALECTVATGNASAVTTITISYTNDAGVAGRTGTIQSFPATAVAGTFVPFALQSQDNGIRSIESITLGTSLVSGGVNLVVYREMASLGTALSNVTAKAGAIDLGMPRVYDNSVLFPTYLPQGTFVGQVTAGFTFAQG